eukprot:TRINITY_DN30126_c0_g1_i2.p1 TRINITY_DN30126_c0_g1~~TRINITY_DN30126_c0_g1_i2.p1  ORF type:complete len:322 (-),score=65.24 TRINITY_DN30126_c0_g1_i2:16-981(-)
MAPLAYQDQRIATQLVYRWEKELGMRTLWIPNLYHATWAITGGYLSRDDATFFKHMDPILDLLVEEAKSGRRALIFANASTESAADVEGGWIAWDRQRAWPRAWLRSLCLDPPGRPRLAGSVAWAQLYLDLRGDQGYVRWSSRHEAPAAWNGAVDLSLDRAFTDSAAARAALPRSIADLQDVSGGFSDEWLFSRGLSAALSLGTWRVDRLTGARRYRAIGIDLGLLNDGSETWPELSLCPDEEANATLPVRVPHVHSVKGVVPPRFHAKLHMRVELKDLRAIRGRAEVRWYLCDLSRGTEKEAVRRFGVLLRAIVIGRRPT